MKKLLVLGLCLLSLVGCGQKEERERLNSFCEMTMEEIELLAEELAEEIVNDENYSMIIKNSGHEDQIRETIEQDIYNTILDNLEDDFTYYAFEAVNDTVDTYYPLAAQRMK